MVHDEYLSILNAAARLIVETVAIGWTATAHTVATVTGNLVPHLRQWSVVQIGQRAVDRLLGPLIELRSELSSHVRRGGTVVLSGILSDQTDALVKAYADDFHFKRPRRKDTWVLLEGVRI